MEEAKKETEEVLKLNQNLVVDNEYLQTLLTDNAPLKTYDESSNVYTSDLTQSVMNLLDCNVAVHNVGRVIKTVSHLCGRVPNKLPSRQTVDRINDQRIAISTKQLESVAEKKDLTLYSDETSKYGRSFEVFAVSDAQKNTYLLGLREMSNKSASTVLDTLKEILNDISEISNGTDTGSRILSCIKNTMSDRAATEKKFQHLLESYRLEILPKVKVGWEQMNDIERDTCGRMNNFFCGLHILVNFADVCAEALNKFEKIMFDSEVVRHGNDECEGVSDGFEGKNAESGTIRLIRTAAKAFSRGVDEKSGVYGPFRTYLETKKDTVRFMKLQHNRFNILFILGQITYHHRHNIADFLENVHGCTNRLLTSVMTDIKVPIFTAGCRVLGIISKFVTAPLWRVIESESHIMEMSEVYAKLHDFLQKASIDSIEVMKGNLLPFSNTNTGDDELLQSDMDLDGITVQILQCLFQAMLHFLKRQTSDHLTGGKYSMATANVWEEKRSTMKHNKLPEVFFWSIGLFNEIPSQCNCFMQ